MIEHPITTSISSSRPLDNLRKQYELEKEMANELRDASPTVRKDLYSQCYDRLFREIPDHPQVRRKSDPSFRSAQVEQQVRRLRFFLSPEMTYLEVGAGDCAVAMAIAPYADYAYAVDISREIAPESDRPSNFAFRMSDGTTMPVEDASIDFAYSNQLIEHLHPDDAVSQMNDIHRALKKGGIYYLITPSLLTGPHDVSKFFGDVAAGLHLQEYTHRTIAKLCTDSGFDKVRFFFTLRQSRPIFLPNRVFFMLDSILNGLSTKARRSIGNLPLIRNIIDIHAVAYK